MECTIISVSKKRPRVWLLCGNNLEEALKTLSPETKGFYSMSSHNYNEENSWPVRQAFRQCEIEVKKGTSFFGTGRVDLGMEGYFYFLWSSVNETEIVIKVFPRFEPNGYPNKSGWSITPSIFMCLDEKSFGNVTRYKKTNEVIANYVLETDSYLCDTVNGRMAFVQSVGNLVVCNRNVITPVGPLPCKDVYLSRVGFSPKPTVKEFVSSLIGLRNNAVPEEIFSVWERLSSADKGTIRGEVSRYLDSVLKNAGYKFTDRGHVVWNSELLKRLVAQKIS